MLKDVLKQASWVFLLRGVVAILFALLLLFAPGMTLATGAFSFVILFGIYALVDGISTIVGAIMNREDQWLLLLVFGVINAIAGLIALGNPLLVGIFTISVMVYVVAFKAIAGGIVEIVSAYQLRKEIDNEWMLTINAIFSLLFGLILLRRPITGIEVLMLITSFYLLMAGVMQLILGFKARGWSSDLDTVQTRARA